MPTTTLSSSIEKTDHPSAREQAQESHSGTIRSVLTLLILFHLFALFVAVAANPPTSEMLFRLKRVPVVAQYLELLGMDLSYRFHLTYGAAEDRGWQVEAVLTMPDQSQQTVVFPDPEMSDIRRQHYQALLLRWAVSPDEGTQAVLAQAVAQRLMEETGAVSADVKLRARFLLNQDEVREGADPDGEQRFTAVYEGRAWSDADTGTVRFMKVEKEGQSAPATGNAAAQPQ